MTTRQEERQRDFNKVWEHFVTKKSPIGIARYRHGGVPTGTPCAVGIFITDEEYTPAMDGAGCVEDLLRNNFIQFKKKKHMQRHRIFFGALQAAHDHAVGCLSDTERLRALIGNLTGLASSWGLQIPGEEA